MTARDRITPFLTDQLLHVHVETAVADVRAILATSDYRDRLPTPSALPILNYDEWQARLAHEAAHAECSRDKGAPDIEVVIRADGSGWCSYGPIANPLDAITVHMVGVAAEARRYAPSIRGYSGGCSDFMAARILIDAWNERGAWPPITCEAAARGAVEFVDARWRQISALALVLGNSGTLCDYDIRLFSRCAR